MRETETEILAAAEVRRALASGSDIRGDIDFQNDVNALLARVEYIQMPWRSLSDLNPAPLASAIVPDATPLPVVRDVQRTRTLAGIGRLTPLVVSARQLPAVRRG
jgi:hypothetical protein